MIQEETSTEQQAHVLVVDDSRLMRVAIKRILQQDYQLTEANDGEQGWEMLINDDSIQVVISDLTMPNLDGFGLLEKIRSSDDERIKNIPVIIITGDEDDEVKKTRAFDCGASDFVTKPFDSVMLRARTKAHVQHDETARKLTAATSALEENTTIDPLTGLANKRHFFERGQECIAFAKRHNTNMSVILLEVDLFDRYFLKYGQEAANKVTKTIASILLSSLRKEDTAARIGIAKFALILVNSNPSGVSNLASRIQTEIHEEAFSTPKKSDLLTVSMGVASTGVVPDYDFEKIMSVAGEQLAIAIEKSGNTIEYAQEVSAEKTTSVQE